jgi:undecaprenyl-diphosphatase
MMVAFVAISAMMVLGITGAWDDAILEWIGTVRGGITLDLMIAATVLGDGEVEIPFALATGLLLWRLGRARCARIFVFCALSGQVVLMLAKQSFQRPRPEIIDKLAAAGWYSYPSGHAMLAPVIWGLGLLLLSQSVSNALIRRVLLVLAVTIPIAIGVSRVYLGVHFPSDVLGALVLGTGWILLWLSAANYRHTKLVSVVG